MSLTIKPLSTYDACIGLLSEEIKNEKSKERVDYSKIALLLLEQASIQQLSCYDTFREQAFRLRERISQLMDKLQENYADEKVKKMQQATGGVQMISGLMQAVGGGMGGFLPKLAAGAAPETLRKVQGFFNGAGSLGSAGAQGIGSFSGIEQSKQQAVREELNHLREEEKNLKEEASRDAEAADRQRQKHEDTIKEIENSKASTFKQIANG